MKKLIISLIVAFFALIVLLISFYFYSLRPVDKTDDTTISFLVESGTGKKEIIKNLKDANLIKNTPVAYVYSFLHKDIVFKAGTFTLKRNMNLAQIFSTLDSGKTKEQDGINVTLQEGLRYSEYLDILSSSLNLKKDDFEQLLNTDEYLNTLIGDYWFLTSDILNDNIYYALEGYLFPDTYNFKVDATAEDVIITILDNTEQKLNQFKEDIENNSRSIHEIITLASIVELEGKDNSDRAGIAQVFLNRIASNIPLGSDVTTYYAFSKGFDQDLSVAELNTCNNYNTRCLTYLGLPVGPVSNPGIEAIKAAIYPEANDYLYFVSDKNGKIYFSTTNTEHEQIVADLKASDMWYEYE